MLHQPTIRALAPRPALCGNVRARACYVVALALAVSLVLWGLIWLAAWRVAALLGVLW
jgi:hypothetical protein